MDVRTLGSSARPNAPANTQTYDPAKQFVHGSLSRHDLHTDPLRQFRVWFEYARTKGLAAPETATLSTAHLPSGRVSARMVYLKSVQGGEGHTEQSEDEQQDGNGRARDKDGFVVYSNWETSRKSHDVRSNPQAALTFWWRELERQVRVEGRVERLSSEESQAYFDSRIRGSRIGAWASPQSQVLRPTGSVPRAGTSTGGSAAGQEDVITTTETATPHDDPSERHSANDSLTRDTQQDARDHDGADDGRAELDQRVKDVEDRFSNQPDQNIPVPPFWGGIRIVPDTVEFWQGRPSRLHDRFRYTKVVSHDGTLNAAAFANAHGREETVDGRSDVSVEGREEKEERGKRYTWLIERLAP